MKNQATLTSMGVKKNHAPNKYESRRELLGSTKLSRLPSLPKRAVFNSKNTCAGCQVKLTEANQKVKSLNVCASCLSIFAAVSAEIDRAADRKSRAAIFEQFGGSRR